MKKTVRLEGLAMVEAHLPFRGGIEGIGGLIEDQHPRVLQDRSSQGRVGVGTGEAGAALAYRSCSPGASP